MKYFFTILLSLLISLGAFVISVLLFGSLWDMRLSEAISIAPILVCSIIIAVSTFIKSYIEFIVVFDRWILDEYNPDIIDDMFI